MSSTTASQGVRALHAYSKAMRQIRAIERAEVKLPAFLASKLISLKADRSDNATESTAEHSQTGCDELRFHLRAQFQRHADASTPSSSAANVGVLGTESERALITLEEMLSLYSALHAHHVRC
jgi:hypothetical protein